MSLATNARALVSRQASAEAATAPGFSTSAIVGITLGGAGFLVLLSISIIHLRYVRHKKRMEKTRSVTVNNASNLNTGRPDVVQTQPTFYHNFHLSRQRAAAWEGICSQEDLQLEIPFAKRHTEKQKSDMLSWPLPRKFSTKKISLLRKPRTSFLSSIPESPGNLPKSPQLPEIRTCNCSTEDFLPPDLESNIPPPVPKVAGDSQADPGSQSPLSSVSPTKKKLATLVGGGQSHVIQTHNFHTQSSRTMSGPSVLTNVPGSAIQHSLSPDQGSHTRSRSFSLGMQDISTAPDVPLPPLPNHVRQLETSIQERPNSNDSLSSLDSTGTSVLNMNSPSAEAASVGFSRRHPELGLGIRVREGETDLKRTLMAGPTQARVRSKINNSPRLLSSVGSLRIASARNSIELKKMSFVGSNNATKASNSFLCGPVQTAQRVTLSRPSSLASQTDNSTSIAPTPKLDSQKRKVTDGFGSPIERRGNSVQKYRIAKSSMPPRETSQTSTQTTASSSSLGNPFQWDSPLLSTKRSSLRTSPVSKKMHKRRSSIRDSIPPVLLPAPSRNSSSSKMRQIAEESSDTSHLITRPPSSTSFAPQLRNPLAYRASLATRSSTRSVLYNGQDVDDEDMFVRFVEWRRDSSPAKTCSIRESNASSMNIPTFPEPEDISASESGPDRHRPGESEPVSPQVMTSSPFSSSPRQQIPGLSLLEQGAASGQKLVFPTIELAPSPGAQSAEYCPPDSPVIPCPSSPRPAQGPIGSSPPIPRSISPPLKSSATTKLSQPLPIRSQRITPLSSIVNPMNTKPSFLPPTADPAVLVPYHMYPDTSRAAQAPPVLNTARALRRMNTETDIMEDRDAQRHFWIGREMSPNSSLYNVQLATPPPDDNGLYGEEKENEGHRGGDEKWDDGDDFWSSNNGGDKGGHVLLEARANRRFGVKKVEWGSVNISETTPSAASEGDVSFGEADFF